MSAPRIGVTGPDKGGFVAWTMTALALRRAGAKAVRIKPTNAVDEDSLDGFIIGGGSDVDPFQYGETPQAKESASDHTFSFNDWLVSLLLYLPRIIFARHKPQLYDKERDQREKHIIRHALYSNKPLLGICRGAQLINVTLGGSLHQNIDQFYNEDTTNVRSVLPSKRIEISKDSILADILKTESCSVNALHNQSINKPGDGVLFSAKEASGVVQAIERNSQSLVIGVQWHPEYMPQSQRQQGLFRHLVACCKGSMTADASA